MTKKNILIPVMPSCRQHYVWLSWRARRAILHWQNCRTHVIGFLWTLNFRTKNQRNITAIRAYDAVLNPGENALLHFSCQYQKSGTSGFQWTLKKSQEYLATTAEQHRHFVGVLLLDNENDLVKCNQGVSAIHYGNRSAVSRTWMSQKRLILTVQLQKSQ